MPSMPSGPMPPSRTTPPLYSMTELPDKPLEVLDSQLRVLAGLHARTFPIPVAVSPALRQMRDSRVGDSAAAAGGSGRGAAQSNLNLTGGKGKDRRGIGECE